jgi:hypothetical protein
MSFLFSFLLRQLKITALHAYAAACEGGKNTPSGSRFIFFKKRGRIPQDSGFIFPFAGSVLVCEREQLLL